MRLTKAEIADAKKAARRIQRWRVSFFNSSGDQVESHTVRSGDSEKIRAWAQRCVDRGYVYLRAGWKGSDPEGGPILRVSSYTVEKL